MAYDLIIVLGGGVKKNGELPSWVQRRLDRAYELYSEGTSNRIIVAGKGIESNVIEANAMFQHLLDKGIPPIHLLKEPLSIDTLQNAFFSKVIHVDPMKMKKLLVITSEFHAERAASLFDWIFGDGYQIECETVSDEDIPEEALKQRKLLEKQLLAFYVKHLYTSIPAGDVEAIHSFIFNPEEEHAQAYAAFLKEIKLTQGKHNLYQ